MSVKTTKDDLVPRMIRDFADELRDMAEETRAQDLSLEMQRIAGFLERIAAAVAAGDHDTANAMKAEVDAIFEDLQNRKLRN